MKTSEALFSWAKDGADVSAVFRAGQRAAAGAPDARAAVDAWRQLVLGHATDLYHDQGAEALAWPHVLRVGVHGLTTLARLDPSALPTGTVTRHVGGLTLGLRAEGGGARVGGGRQAHTQDPEATGPAPARVLTMDDVQRELEVLDCEMILGITRDLYADAPETGLAPASVAVGMACAVAVAGRLVGTPQVILEAPSAGWTATLEWSDWDRGPGPTGEAIPPGFSLAHDLRGDVEPGALPG